MRGCIHKASYRVFVTLAWAFITCLELVACVQGASTVIRQSLMRHALKIGSMVADRTSANQEMLGKVSAITHFQNAEPLVTSHSATLEVNSRILGKGATILAQPESMMQRIVTTAKSSIVSMNVSESTLSKRNVSRHARSSGPDGAIFAQLHLVPKATRHNRRERIRRSSKSQLMQIAPAKSDDTSVYSTKSVSQQGSAILHQMNAQEPETHLQVVSSDGSVAAVTVPHGVTRSSIGKMHVRPIAQILPDGHAQPLEISMLSSIPHDSRKRRVHQALHDRHRRHSRRQTSGQLRDVLSTKLLRQVPQTTAPVVTPLPTSVPPIAAQPMPAAESPEALAPAVATTAPDSTASDSQQGSTVLGMLGKIIFFALCLIAVGLCSFQLGLRAQRRARSISSLFEPRNSRPHKRESMREYMSASSRSGSDNPASNARPSSSGLRVDDEEGQSEPDAPKKTPNAPLLAVPIPSLPFRPNYRDRRSFSSKEPI